MPVHSILHFSREGLLNLAHVYRRDHDQFAHMTFFPIEKVNSVTSGNTLPVASCTTLRH